METVRRVVAVTWAAMCVGAFLVLMLLTTIESTRNDGTARDAVFRALGGELWIWLLAFAPLAAIGIGAGRWVVGRVIGSRTAVDVGGPPIGLVLMTVLVGIVIGVLSRV